MTSLRNESRPSNKHVFPTDAVDDFVVWVDMIVCHEFLCIMSHKIIAINMIGERVPT